jgi:hypothetical protein
MKHIIALILTLIICVSCITPSQTFLANKHCVNDWEITMIQEKKTVAPYSPYFELKKLVDLTNKGITIDNYDSIQYVYSNIQKNENKSNCIAYDVIYEIDSDTLSQRVFFIDGHSNKVTHDNDIIIRMNRQVKRNIYRFLESYNKNIMYTKIQNDSIFI